MPRGSPVFEMLLQEKNKSIVKVIFMPNGSFHINERETFLKSFWRGMMILMIMFLNLIIIIVTIPTDILHGNFHTGDQYSLVILYFVWLIWYQKVTSNYSYKIYFVK